MKEKGNDAMRGERRIREIKARAIAAGITVAFMLTVIPDANPALWGVTLVALLMYEGLRVSILYIWKMNLEQKRRYLIEANKAAMKQDAARWSNEWIRWPMKEVS
jgi:hypothetical protein